MAFLKTQTNHSQDFQAPDQCNQRILCISTCLSQKYLKPNMCEPNFLPFPPNWVFALCSLLLESTKIYPVIQIRSLGSLPGHFDLLHSPSSDSSTRSVVFFCLLNIFWLLPISSIFLSTTWVCYLFCRPLAVVPSRPLSSRSSLARLLPPPPQFD